MSTSHTGNTQPSIDQEEHRSVGGINTKATTSYDWSGTALTPHPLPFLTKPFDRLIITYTDSTKTVTANIVTKLAGVTQETLTNSSTTTIDDFQRS